MLVFSSLFNGSRNLPLYFPLQVPHSYQVRTVCQLLASPASWVWCQKPTFWKWQTMSLCFSCVRACQCLCLGKDSSAYCQIQSGKPALVQTRPVHRGKTWAAWRCLSWRSECGGWVKNSEYPGAVKMRLGSSWTRLGTSFGSVFY